MKIFISWSGDVAKQVAEQLKVWLPSVIQSVVPFASSRDIQTGGRWFAEIGKQLDETNFGILCVTPENMNSPWMLFEAGALQKNVASSKIAPLLIGLPKEQLPQPLALFQMCATTKEEIFHLVDSVNNTVPSGKLSQETLVRTFDLWWPQLEKVLQVAEQKVREAASARPRPQPTMTEVLKALQETREVTEGIARSIAGLQQPYTPPFGMPPIQVGGAKGAAPPNLGAWGNTLWGNSLPGVVSWTDQKLGQLVTDQAGNLVLDQSGRPIFISQQVMPGPQSGPEQPRAPQQAPTNPEKKK